MNYVVYKLAITNFELQITPKVFDFAYYSFHSMLLGEVHDIIPIGTLAKILDILAPFCSILITGTLITLFFSIRSEQYKESLRDIIEFSDDQLSILLDFLVEVHQISFDEAFQYLKSKKSYVCLVVEELEEINGS